ncbi:MAG: S-layer homology domain-containing protein [Clostridia bacterium]|nr:S-layer homology domain-containing protein [Clostridia bacterium]
MKRITALLLTALMILTALPVLSFAGRFEDVSDGKWYSEGISFCAANEYMAGTSEAIFDRSGSLTRAMFVTILAKLDDADVAEYWGESSFTDVKPGKWYSTSIEWAYQNGLAAGVGEGIFGYKLAVTRAQIATFLYVYAEYVNEKNKADADKQIDVTLRADLTVFKDVDRVPSWAKNAMEWAVASQLFGGVGEGYLDPRGNCTRAQAAVLIRAFVLNFLSDCEHEWTEATCTEMSVCSKCALKNATELGHDIPYHLCINDQKCTRCDYVEVAKDHDVVYETCTTSRYCSVCNVELAPARGHNPYQANCTMASYCMDCNAFVAPALGHTTSYGICSRCNSGVFPTSYDALYYYLNNNGYTFFNDGTRGYYSKGGDSSDKNGYFQRYTYIVPPEKMIYLTVIRKDTITGKSARLRIELPDSNGRYYNFTMTLFDDNQTYGTVSGTLDTETYLQGKFSLKNYSGSEAARTEVMDMTAYMLKYNVPASCQATLNNFELRYHGILGEFGFKNC